jgi:hypothetical protein
VGAEDNAYVLLPVKVRPEVKVRLQASIKARAAQLRLAPKDPAALAGEVLQALMEVEI